MRCGACGAEVADDSEFCPGCLGDPRSPARNPPLPVPVQPPVVDALEGPDLMDELEPNWVLDLIQRQLLRAFLVVGLGLGATTGYVLLHPAVRAGYGWLALVCVAAAGGGAALLVRTCRRSPRADHRWGGMTPRHWAFAVGFLFAVGFAAGSFAS